MGRLKSFNIKGAVPLVAMVVLLACSTETGVVLVATARGLGGCYIVRYEILSGRLDETTIDWLRAIFNLINSPPLRAKVKPFNLVSDNQASKQSIQMLLEKIPKSAGPRVRASLTEFLKARDLVEKNSSSILEDIERNSTNIHSETARYMASRTALKESLKRQFGVFEYDDLCD